MRRYLTLLSPCVFVLVASLSLGAQAPETGPDKFRVSIDDLINDTQRVVRGPDHSGMVWWIPAEFWKTIMETQGRPEEAITKEIEPFRKYTMIAVVVGKTGIFGITWVLEADVCTSIVLRDSDGVDYPPLETAPKDVDVTGVFCTR